MEEKQRVTNVFHTKIETTSKHKPYRQPSKQTETGFVIEYRKKILKITRTTQLTHTHSSSQTK